MITWRMLKQNSASIQRRYLLREQRKLSMSTIKQRYCVTKIHQNVYVKVCTTALLIVRFKLNYSLTGFLCSHCFCTFHNKLYTAAITLTRWKQRGSIWKTFSSYNMKIEETFAGLYWDLQRLFTLSVHHCDCDVAHRWVKHIASLLNGKRSKYTASTFSDAVANAHFE